MFAAYAEFPDVGTMWLAPVPQTFWPQLRQKEQHSEEATHHPYECVAGRRAPFLMVTLLAAWIPGVPIAQEVGVHCFGGAASCRRYQNARCGLGGL
jgi:hypothetical protein